MKNFEDLKLRHPLDVANQYNLRRKIASSPRQKLLESTKRNAYNAGIEHSITIDDIQIPLFCPVFGTPILLKKDRKAGPSVDRIDPCKGYVKGNVRVISMEANRLKNNGTIEQFEQIISYIKSNT